MRPSLYWRRDAFGCYEPRAFWFWLGLCIQALVERRIEKRARKVVSGS